MAPANHTAGPARAGSPHGSEPPGPARFHTARPAPTRPGPRSHGPAASHTARLPHGLLHSYRPAAGLASLRRAHTAPFRIIDLVSGDAGGDRRGQAAEDPRGPMGGPCALQEPPSPSRLVATAWPRPGSRIQSPGGTRVEAVYKTVPHCVSPQDVRLRV